MPTTADPLVVSSPPIVESTTLNELVRKAAVLYSLPAVAAEVLELTNEPDVDAAALRSCIEQDPALTVKLLRVVNSSLFGLSGKVSDLNQAIALLGVKPLKLLVLGFSLPERLFVDVAGDQLELYWRTSLARAVAAREISEQMFKQPGDDAFLAGLLQDVGILVLLSSVGQPYAEFHRQAIDDGVDLADTEQESLGFNHVQLSAALLAYWHMPDSLVRAISEPRDVVPLTRSDRPHACLTRVLHLADLLAQLVVRRRLNVLPELMEAGGAYCELTKPGLNELVAALQDKVDQLAEVLSVTTGFGEDYSEILVNAHKQIVTLVDDAVDELPREAVEIIVGSPELAGKAAMLQTAVSDLSEQSQAADGHPADADQLEALPSGAGVSADFDQQLILIVGGCRAGRQPLSAAYLAVECEKPLDGRCQSAVEQIFNVICRRIDVEDCIVNPLSATHRMLLLPGCERHEAVSIVDAIVQQIRTLLLRMQSNGQLPGCVASAGVASVGTPPKNFPPQALLETARRCQAAAQAAGGVKSLEIC